MDSPQTAPPTEAQPKILQRMLVRFAIGLFLVAGLIFGYQWWKGYSQDPDLPRDADTAGMIAAIELLDEGSQAVVVKEDGELVRSPDYLDGKTDKEPGWRPDGNRLFFISDREKGTYHVYRWNLASNKVMLRAFGTRSQSSPTFAPPSAPQANESLLLTSGGVVLEFEPRTGRSIQVLPPVIKDRGAGEDSSAGQFERMYRQLGTSFRMAKWSKDKRYVAAIMRREDDSEILIVQDVVDYKDPQIVVAGQKVEVDLNPETGDFVFLANGFRFPNDESIPPEAIKNGKVVLPFSSIIGLVNPSMAEPPAPIITSPDATIGFQRIRVSPDGQNLVFVAGTLDPNQNFEPRELAVVPARAGAAQSVKRLLTGRIFEPSWHPNSQKIAFVMYDEQKKRSIHTVGADGSALTNVTKGKGDFSFPEFSPQQK